MPTLNTTRFFTKTNTVYTHQSNYTGFVHAATSTQRQVFTETRIGNTNPKWRDQVRAGVQAGTAFTLEATALVSQDAGAYTVITAPDQPGPLQWTKWERVYSDAGLGVVGSHLSVDAIKADNQALTRIRENVRSQTEQFNALVTIGEGRETLRQLRKPYASIQNAMANYADASTDKVQSLAKARGKPLPRKAKAKKVRAILADTWLESTFGLLPTMSDVGSAATALARYYSGDLDKRSKITGRCVVDRNSTSTVYNLNDFPVKYGIIDRKETQLGVHYRCGIVEKTYSDFNSWERLGDLSGFRLENFVPTLYELVPFSWLADYVTTLGSALNANQVDLTNVTWVVRSEKTRTTFSIEKPIDVAATYALHGSTLRKLVGTSLGKTVGTRTNMSRSLLTAGTLPSVLPRVRSLSEAFKPIRAVNVLAVISGKVGRLDKAIKLYLR